MFDLALKAKLPIIGVQTDDPVNFKAVVSFYTGNPQVVALAQKTPATLGPYIYWTEDEERVTVEVYELFRHMGRQLIVQNPKSSNPLIFDAGFLPTPEPMVKALLAEMLDGANSEVIDRFYQALKGLSLRVVREVILLTSARCDGVTVPEIRRTRASLFGALLPNVSGS